MEIAIFPIPNCVTFPGQLVSLHVFEPRYRQMVEDCVREARPMAICGVKRLIEKAKETNSPKAHNLATFEPVPVVTYGQAEVIERMADGRLLIEVRMEQRARIKTLTDLEPYYLAEVDPVVDEEVPPSAHQSLLRAEIGARFEALWNLVRANSAPLPVSLDTLTFSQFSFQILGFLQTDTVLAQLLLEETNPERRASILLDILFSLETRIAS